jgi:hypothetical protein
LPILTLALFFQTAFSLILSLNSERRTLNDKIGFVFSNYTLSTRFPTDTVQQASGHAAGVVGF